MAKRKEKISYCKKFLCFDIETKHEHISEDCDIIYTWHWMIMDSEYQAFSTQGENRLIIYVHNLSYEMEAIIRNLEGHTMSGGFYMDTHEPLYLIIDDVLEFRCS